MANFIKRLLKDKRGNALVIGGAALPFLVGAAGLATDTVQWVLWKRQLQRAADSAAFAGVYARSAGDSASDAVATDLNNNNQAKNASKVSLLSGYPSISYPTSVNYTYGVKVDLAIQQTLSFSSLFLSTAPTITASATAGLVDQGNYCGWALKKSGGAGITIGGSSSTNLGCPIISNSNANPSIATNGTSYSFVAPEATGAGSLPSSINGVTTLKPYHMQMQDPYAGKYSTSVPSDANCGNLNQGKYTKNGQTWLKSYESGKVCYSGNNGFKFSGGTYYLDPGTYYLDSTDFDTTGGTTLYGTGVTIILTGTTPGSVSTNGNSTIQLSAPTSTTSPYYKMLFIQASNATLNNDNTINGNATSSFDGAFYFPSGQVSFTGSSGAATKCAMVVGYTLVFTGNTNLQNNTTGCTANTTVSGKAIKLFA